MTKDIEFLQRETGSQPRHAVIWLHGLGADGGDFYPVVPQLRLQPDRPVRFIFPHAPMRPVTINAGMVMRAWYDVRALDFVLDEDEPGFAETSRIVDSLIEAQIRLGIPAGNIVLAGFSQGGAAVLHAGLRFPQRLAGIVCLSAYLPFADRLEQEAHAANRRTPIFTAHGLFDPVVPYFLGENSKNRLIKAGYAVTWKTYGMQHSVNDEELADLSAWLTDRLR